MTTTFERVNAILRERFNSLSLTQKILAGVGGLVIGFATYATTYIIGYRIIEKRKPFNSYTTSVEAINGVNLSNKIAIVTGCNTGIGKETVKILYKQNCTVVMACRNTEAAEKAMTEIQSNVNSYHGNITVMKLDLSSLQSVRDFAEGFSKKYKKLDLLINNAGIMWLPQYKESKEGYELQFAVNHLGHFYLTNLLLPQLETSRGRVITLSSSAHRLTSFKEFDDFLDFGIQLKTGPRKDLYSAMPNYGIAKSCNVFFARELNRRYAKAGVVSVSLHPGSISGTSLSRNAKLDFGEILKVLSIYTRHICMASVFL